MKPIAARDGAARLRTLHLAHEEHAAIVEVLEDIEYLYGSEQAAAIALDAVEKGGFNLNVIREVMLARWPERAEDIETGMRELGYGQ